MSGMTEEDGERINGETRRRTYAWQMNGQRNSNITGSHSSKNEELQRQNHLYRLKKLMKSSSVTIPSQNERNYKDYM